MAFTSSLDTTWFLFTLPSIVGTHNVFNNGPFMCSIFMILSTNIVLLTWLLSPGGLAWKNGRTKMGRVSIPGPRGLPIFGSLLTLSRGLPHRTLACMASSRAMQLMAFSLGSTPVVVSSDPRTAREILTSPHFANRPIKQSARDLMFTRAIGFAPDGTYWRLLRRVASSHLFAPKRIAAHEAGRQLDCSAMLCSIGKEQSLYGFVVLRKHLQSAALENIMGTVFGKRYGVMGHTEEARELNELVREGFDLLGAFNWSDYLPWISYVYDPFRIKSRCLNLVPRVRKLVKRIIDEHRVGESKTKVSDDSDFVDVLLSLDGYDKLNEDDMIAVLWEMIFRGTDTTALLTEWVMAELILNSDVQDKLYHELNNVVGDKSVVTDADVAKMPYLQAVVKETLRVHPPGPLLSWARMSTSDVQLSNGMVIPANTTAMVNMWAITHDPAIWEEPAAFKPERYMSCSGGSDVDVRGRDLRLAPFGAGRRVCPGKNLGLATVSLWVARLVQRFEWGEDMVNPVDLSEVLKLSCEMKSPLSAVVTPRPGNWV